MVFLKRLLLFLCLPTFIFPPEVIAGVKIKENKSEMFYQKILSLAERKAEKMAILMPKAELQYVLNDKNNAVEEELNQKIAFIEKANPSEINQFKRDLIKLNEQEIVHMSQELRSYLEVLSEKELMSFGDFLGTHRFYQAETMSYRDAFTLEEKKQVLRNAISLDFNFLRSHFNKRIALSSKESLIKDLRSNLFIFKNTNQQKGEIKKILQISLLVLAGVALVTWGISSAVYGARLKRYKSDRENQLNQLKDDLAAKYQAYENELTAAEEKFLAENNYVRTLCGTFSQPDSILCNRFDYQLFTGIKYCSVYCYKQLSTGKETLHEPASCTSPFIPANCYDPQEYWDAYAIGKDDGYDVGYNSGYSSGSSDGQSDGSYDGRQDGYYDGNSDGYYDGYNDGYAQGSSSKSISLIPYLRSESYLQGYRDGLEQYQILFLNF